MSAHAHCAICPSDLQQSAFSFQLLTLAARVHVPRQGSAVNNTPIDQTTSSAPKDVFYFALIGLLALFIWGTLLYFAGRAW